MTYHDSLSKVTIKDMGYTKKEIKDAYPKKVCHMPKRHEKKECQEKKKDAYPKKICHMSTRHVEKKEEKKIYIYI